MGKPAMIGSQLGMPCDKKYYRFQDSQLLKIPERIHDLCNCAIVAICSRSQDNGLAEDSVLEGWMTLQQFEKVERSGRYGE